MNELDYRYPHQIARCQIELNDNNNALKNIEKSIALGNDKSNVLWNKEIVLGKLERYDEAIAVGKEYIEKFPDSKDIPFLYTNMSLDQIWMENYSEAITLAEKSLELDPENYVAYARIGYANEQLEKFDEAIEILEENLEKFDDSHINMVIRCLIRCNKKLGNKVKQEEYEKRLKELKEED